MHVSGKVFTFYSMKMGVGRSMALASTAWILARKGNRVLVIDWDFDNPGIFRYFNTLSSENEVVKSSPGLIDLCWEAVRAGGRQHKDILGKDGGNVSSPISAYITSLHHEFGKDGKVDIMPAGQQDRKFNVRLRYFSWSEFYDRFDGMAIFEAMFDWMVATYDYVLIDSLNGRVRSSELFPFVRTDKLVVCFTFDQDSINTTAKAAAFIKSRMAPKLQVFPTPMRVQYAETALLNQLRAMAQHVFAPHPTYVSQGDRKRYWGNVEIPEVPYYAYAHELPPLRDAAEDPKTLAAAYDRLITYLTDTSVTEAEPLDEDLIQAQMPGQYRTDSSDEKGDYWEMSVRPYEGEGVFGFVSYARNDVDMVMPLIQDINYLDYHLWWDEGIPGAIEWFPHLEQRIKQAKYLLVFLSSRAVVSEYVYKEVEIARKNRKPILAVRLDGTSLPQSIAELLGGYQILDVSGFSFEEKLGKTLRVMHQPVTRTTNI